MSSTTLRITGGCLLATVLVAGCGYRGQETSGHVYEVVNFQDAPHEWKFEPLEDVEVAVVWYGLVNAFSAQSKCLRAVTLRTDRDGAFLAPAWQSPGDDERVSRIDARSAVFKPGFVEVNRQDQQTFAAWPSGREVHVLLRSDEIPPGYDRNSALAAANGCPRTESK